MTSRPIQGSDEIDVSWLDDKPSQGEVDFACAWVSQFPDIDLHTEVKLIEGRKFRYDFVHYPSKTAIEVQGLTDHASVKGVLRDQEKLMEALSIGWVVVQIAARNVNDLRWLYSIQKIIEIREGKKSF